MRVVVRNSKIVALTVLTICVFLTSCSQRNAAVDCAAQDSPGAKDCRSAENAGENIAEVPNNIEASETRSFQMALWDNVDGLDADLAFFSEGQSQPTGRSILRLTHWLDRHAQTNAALESKIAGFQYDWSRIVAVLVDEPYWYHTGANDRSNPCRNPADPRNDQVARIATQLADAATVINRVSQSTRFWVNFSVPEIEWAMDPQCPVQINQTYIDVISLDSYWGNFADAVRPYYDWLSNNRATAYQQFALVPGTFFRSGVDDQYVRASYLRGYFDYANAANRMCDLPLGRVGITGNWDRCPVWLVLGWLASSPLLSDGHVWRGVFDPLSSIISAEWKAQLAYPKLDPMVGKVEAYDPATRTFTGWAVNGNTAGVSAQVELWVEDQYWGGTVADQYRSDLADVHGKYHSGFSLTIPDKYLDGRCHEARIYAVAPTTDVPSKVVLPSAIDSSVCLAAP